MDTRERNKKGMCLGMVTNVEWKIKKYSVLNNMELI